MVNRIVLTFLAVVIAFLLPVLGCSSGSGEGASPQSAAVGGGKENQASGAKEPVIIEFSAGMDPSGEMQRSVDRFNASRQDIQVKLVELPQVPNEQLTRYTTWFNSKSKTPDLLLMDVIWPKMFASAGWIAPIDEYVDETYLSQFWPAAVEVGRIDGKQYGIQSWMDVGMLYYRKDLLEKYGHEVPKTWSELIAVSQDILAKEQDPNLVGYVFQAAKIEGATINWLEFLWGLGGEVLDADNKIKVDSEAGIEAMRTMHGLVFDAGVSPISVGNSNPNDNNIVFGNGNAIFMRNWPNQYAALKETKVEGKYDVAAIPHSDGYASHASTGGWVYAVNSESRHVKEAVEVMKFFLSEAEQKSAAIESSRIPSIRSVFSYPEVIAKQPVFEKLPEFLESAKSRPALRAYEQFSRALQTEINLVMNGQKDPEQGMIDAQKEIDKIAE